MTETMRCIAKIVRGKLSYKRYFVGVDITASKSAVERDGKNVNPGILGSSA
jgi:hypothetical protein